MRLNMVAIAGAEGKRALAVTCLQDDLACLGKTRPLSWQVGGKRLCETPRPSAKPKAVKQKQEASADVESTHPCMILASGDGRTSSQIDHTPPHDDLAASWREMEARGRTGRCTGWSWECICACRPRGTQRWSVVGGRRWVVQRLSCRLDHDVCERLQGASRTISSRRASSQICGSIRLGMAVSGIVSLHANRIPNLEPPLIRPCTVKRNTNRWLDPCQLHQFTTDHHRPLRLRLSRKFNGVNTGATGQKTATSISRFGQVLCAEALLLSVLQARPAVFVSLFLTHSLTFSAVPIHSFLHTLTSRYDQVTTSPASQALSVSPIK